MEPDSRTAVRLKISFKGSLKKKKEEEERDLTGGDISLEFNHQGFERLKQGREATAKGEKNKIFVKFLRSN